MKIHQRYIPVAFLLWASALSGQARLHIGDNSSLVCSGAPFIVLNDAAFESAGQLDAGQSTLLFAGSAPGAAALAEHNFDPLSNIAIHRPGGELRLESDIDLTGDIAFENGGLNLNNHTAFFIIEAGELKGEAPLRRAFGPAGGQLAAGKLLLFPEADNAGQLGAAITAAGSLSYTEVRRGHALHFTPGGHSISRWYELSSVGGAGIDMLIRFSYFDEELNGLDENQLIAWRSTDHGLSWEPVAVNTRNTVENWLEIFGENLHGLYTFAYPGIEPRQIKPGEKPDIPSPAIFTGLKVFPNPARSDVHLLWHSELEGATPVFWLNAGGQLVQAETVQFLKGPNRLTFDISGLPAGMYTLLWGGLEGPAVKVVKGD